MLWVIFTAEDRLLFIFLIGTVLQWWTITFRNLNTHKSKEMAFIWQRRRDNNVMAGILVNHGKVNKIGDKVHLTASITISTTERLLLLPFGS